MRKLVIFVAFFLSSFIAHAENNQLFDCMDAATFEVNSQCIQDKISQNIHFRETQSKIVEQSSQLGGNVMATMTYYPEQRLIEIVAHRDALNQANFMAMVNNHRAF